MPDELPANGVASGAAMAKITAMSDAPSAKKSKKQVFLSRLFSTLLMWGLVAGTFVSGNAWAFIALVGLLGGLCLYELLEMSGSRVRPGIKFAVGVIGIVTAAGLAHSAKGDGHLLPTIAIGGLALVSLKSFYSAMRVAPAGDKTLVEIFLPILSYLLAVVMFFGSVVVLLFRSPGEGAVPGAWLVLACIAITKFSDMGAYITGVSFGKKKMIPHISPGKTWAGFVGALAFPLATSCALYAAVPEKLQAIPSWADAIVIGLILGLVAVVGDLAASVVKRCLERKDSGAFLPGIGGIFDLVDSICFSAPFLWLYLSLRGGL